MILKQKINKIMAVLYELIKSYLLQLQHVSRFRQQRGTVVHGQNGVLKNKIRGMISFDGAKTNSK